MSRKLFAGIRQIVLERNYRKGYIVATSPKPQGFQGRWTGSRITYHWSLNAASREAQNRGGIIFDLRNGYIYKPTFMLENMGLFS